MKTLTVTNVLTDEKTTYVNNFTLEHNLITTILLITNRASQLHNEMIRARIKELNKIDNFYSSVDNKSVCFCENFNLYARFE